MPRLDLRLAAEAHAALAVVRAGEFSRAAGIDVIRRQWTLARLEALYELAYLRVFSAWEHCLEDVFYRSLCGFSSRLVGQETLVTPGYFRSVASAEASVLGGGHFLLWHNAHKVIDRCQKFIKSGLQEAVVSSSQSRLDDWGAVRHRIAHDHADAKAKFDVATMNIAGRIYLASRPGRFLRDWDSATNRRWIDVAISELVGLASQMV